MYSSESLYAQHKYNVRIHPDQHSDAARGARLFLVVLVQLTHVPSVPTGLSIDVVCHTDIEENMYCLVTK